MSTQIVTKESGYRASFCHLDAPNKFDKYSLSLLVPKDDNEFVAELTAARDEAAAEALTTKWGGKAPRDLAFPVIDGDQSDYEEEHGHWVVRCNAVNKPPVYNAQGVAIDPKEAYSGCYVRAQLNVYAYNWNDGTKKGISIGLNAVMKVAEGEKLGNAGNASPEVFGVKPPENEGAAAFGSPVGASATNPFGAEGV